MNIYEAVDKLNELHGLDPSVLNNLTKIMVPCNIAMAIHPTIQVSQEGEEFKIGMLGILNGLFSIGGNCIGARYDNNDQLVDFVVLKLPNNK
jgi:hypothetical protein